MLHNALRRLLIICAFGVGHPMAAAEIAITLDDLPYVLASRTTPAEGLAQVVAINRALKAHDITATGFAVGQHIKRDTQPVLDVFVQAGHTIGNHSWSHPDYGMLTKRQFRKEVRWTDKALRKWMNGPKFYRFPYLREGETEKAKQAAQNILDGFGYTNVPVTIDNNEWKFNADYVDALVEGDSRKADAIAADYIAHMKERTVHFQTLAHKALGRDVAHIL